MKYFKFAIGFYLGVFIGSAGATLALLYALLH